MEQPHSRSLLLHVVILFFVMANTLAAMDVNPQPLSSADSGPEQVLLDSRYRFNLNEKLGQGTFGTVCSGTCLQTGNSIAIKIVVLDTLPEENETEPGTINIDDEDSLRKARAAAKSPVPRSAMGVGLEIRALRQLREHKNIIKLEDYIQNDNVMFLVLELAEGHPLHKIIQKQELTENNIKRIFHQICSAVAYCHHQLIAHHDLKPENIMVDERTMSAKIIDFGLCIIGIPANKYCREFSGSPLFSAPEVLNHQSYNPYLADAWSLGVILYEMLFESHPWISENYVQLVRAVNDTALEFPAKVTSDQASLLNKILNKHPASRLSVKRILKDKWCQ